jgi:Asp/Glu/hydantoin racemase
VSADAPAPRIALVHALRESVEPIRAAFAEGWPEASTFNLLDDSLSAAVAATGRLDAQIVGRFLELGRYAARERLGPQATRAILFTCSAFGPAIEAVQRDLDIPVHKPNRAAFEEALARGRRIGLLVTFVASLGSLTTELEQLAAARGMRIDVRGALVEGALDALQAGDPASHDRLVGAAAAGMDDVDVIVLGQFSMARARRAMSPSLQARVLTTPDSAVAALRRTLGA